MRETLTIGLAQWLAEPGAPDANLTAALDLIDRLAADGAELVVLPELWPCGYEPTTLTRDAAAAAEPLGGPRMQQLRATARERGLWLMPGSVPEPTAGGIANTAVLIDPRGEIVAAHRKAHPYGEHERAAFVAGDRLTVVETDDLGTVGLCICYDGDFPETGRAMRAAGARFVISPCAYPAQDAIWWDRLYPAAALANGQWWVLVNQVGANDSVTILGGSRVLSPFGELLAEAPRAAIGGRPGPSTVLVQIPLAAESARADAELGPAWQERRPEVYASIPPMSP
jgi:predicted amidohydrolase